MDGQASFDTAIDGVRLVLGKIVAGLGAQQDEYLFHGAVVFRGRAGSSLGVPAEGVAGVSHELFRHLSRQQFVVHQAGGDGAARHAVVLGRIRSLGHDHAALGLDIPQSLGSVTAGAGEHDADGPFVLVLGQ